jgi:hypothetical protein
MKAIGLDYSKVLERYDRGTRLIIQTGDQTLFHISAGVVEIPVSTGLRHAW